jgi:thymidylate synthase
MLKYTSNHNKKNINNENIPIHDENQYLSLIRDINLYGSMECGRNGNALTAFGSSMHFNLTNNIMPILTTKKIAWKTCLKELLWFIKGDTNNKILKNNKVNIWNGNASREFLDSRNLHHLEEDDLGPIYGHQWRHFNAEYDTCNTDYNGKGIDQLEYIIQALNDPLQKTSRRLILSSWNPCQLNEMALPPCHILCQFNVVESNKLSCSLYQRSGDVGLGVPFNISSYCFLTHIIAKHCNLEATDFYYYLGNCHIYDNHVVSLLEQMTKNPYPFPTINIKNKRDNINDYIEDDIEISNYVSNNLIKMEMRK